MCFCVSARQACLRLGGGQSGWLPFSFSLSSVSSTLSSCRSAEGKFLHGPVVFASLASSAYFLRLLDFSVPRCLQKMDSSALGPALPRKCSLPLGIQRPLQGSNRGAWRKNSDLTLGLFLQPPRGFSLIRSVSGST